MTARAATRWIAATAAGVLVAGGVLLTGGAAIAAPGDVAALGGQAALEIHLGPIDIDSSNTVGDLRLTAPGTDSFSATGQTLADFIAADITLGQVGLDVSSAPGGSLAGSTVTDSSVNLFGVSVISLDTAVASALCPVGAPAVAGVTTEGLRVLGIPVAEVPTGGVEQSVVLPASVQYGPDAADTTDLSGLTLTVLVEQVSVADDANSLSIALVASFAVEGTLDDGTVVDETSGGVLGTMLLAGATCSRPATALTATSIDPASGPAAGGQTVTITGTGFVPGTHVIIGSTTVDDVTIDTTGTSLTFVTPAGSGPTAVSVVSRGDIALLASGYTYLAAPTPPPAPPTPTPANVVPAGDGSNGRLASTGLETAPLGALAAGLVALGGLLALTGIRRRRESV